MRDLRYGQYTHRLLSYVHRRQLTVQVEPGPLRVSGRIPDWLDGALLKNGPGTFKDKQVSKSGGAPTFL